MLTRLLTRSPKRRVLCLSLVAVLYLSVALLYSMTFWTAPLGIAWHLFHGTYTTFEGHRIRVPWDMWALHLDAGGLVIVRKVPKYPLLRSPAGIIGIGRGRGPATDMSKYYDRIARVNEHVPSGYRLQGRRQMSAARGTVYCWELASVDSSYLSIDCWFDKDTLGATYQGSSVYRDKFYAMVASVSGAELASTPAPQH